MSVDSLISIEPVHTHCMHARIQNILSEGVVREDRNATENGPPSAHQRNAIVDNGPPLNAGLVYSFVMFRGSGKPYIFVIFQGGPDPLSPSGSAHGMHLKEGTCLKCSFQRVVIIGRKVGLDYNLVCMFAPDQARRTSCLQTLIADRKSRETARCLHTNLLFWFSFLKYRNTMFGSVNQSCYNCSR